MMYPILCIRPWTSLEVHESCEIKVCCYTNFSLGDIRQQSLLEIWNGPRIQQMRAALANHKLTNYCPSWCPRLSDQEYGNSLLTKASIAQDHLRNILAIQDAIERKHRFVAALPIRIQIMPSLRCNIACVMCNQDHSLPDIPFDRYQIPDFWKVLSSLVAVGGEPLINRDYLNLVRAFDPEKYPDCKFKMVTNGMLLTPGIIEFLPRRFAEISLSVDGATKEIYERIRKGAKWMRLTENLTRLAHHPKRDYSIVLIFTVMRSNFREMKAMLNFSNLYGACLLVQPMKSAIKHDEQFKSPEEVTEVLDEIDNLEMTSSQVKILQLDGTRRFYAHLRTYLSTAKE